MNPAIAIPHPSPGLKRFFSPEPLGSRELGINGIGIREWMSPFIVDRPRGTGDYLLMLFHEPVYLESSHQKLEKPDTVIIWTPGKAQYYGCPSQRFSHTWIHCNGSRIATILRQAQAPILKPFHAPDSSLFQQCLLDIHSELVSYTRPDSTIIGNLLENGVRSLMRTTGTGKDDTRIPEGLVAVRRLISTAPSRNMTLKEMAAMAGMSVPYFCSRFKKAFDLSPVECLIQHRMHHAAHLLTNKNLSVTQIAGEVGYDDLFHFSKMFKKHFGHSPRALRHRQVDGSEVKRDFPAISSTTPSKAAQRKIRSPLPTC